MLISLGFIPSIMRYKTNYVIKQLYLQDCTKMLKFDFCHFSFIVENQRLLLSATIKQYVNDHYDNIVMDITEKVEIMKSLNTLHYVEFLGWQIENTSHLYTYELYLFYERCALFSEFPLEFRYISKIVDLVLKLHEQGISHGNISPSSLYMCNLNGNNGVVLLKLGQLEFVTKSEYKLNYKGNPQCAAPETKKGKHYNTIKADLFSLGATLIEIFKIILPDHYNSHNCYLPSINENMESVEYHVPYDKLKLLIELIQTLTDCSPEKRPTLQQIRNHEFFQ